jgi:hypothetical protein
MLQDTVAIMTVVALLALALLLLNLAVFCASVMQLSAPCMGFLFPAKHTPPAQMLASELSCVGLVVGF